MVVDRVIVLKLSSESENFRGSHKAAAAPPTSLIRFKITRAEGTRLPKGFQIKKGQIIVFIFRTAADNKTLVSRSRTTNE